VHWLCGEENALLWGDTPHGPPKESASRDLAAVYTICMLREQPRADETLQGVQQALDSRVWEYDGVEVRNSKTGLGLFATRRFLPGEVIYSTGWLTVKGPVGDLVAQTIVDGRITAVEVTAEHMVVFEDGRWLDVPGAFINHSCAPNMKSVFLDPSGSGQPSVFDYVALVELLPGDQITCDYTRFDWGDDGLEFECQCEAPGCYGLIDGFGGLPPNIQQQAGDTLSMEAKRRWALLGSQE
jgi:hypothetical protein